jgi:BirA family biotin operon repressor/biotin-[acetyl-CoA-carboxylase] ligase
MTVPGRGVRVVRLDETDSTSLLARRELDAARGTGSPPAEPAVYIAATQTGGRGRLGHTWQSPRGGLWLTLAQPLPTDPARRAATLDGLSLRVGVACVRALDALIAALPPHPSPPPRPVPTLKWPNDLLFDGRKVAGILCEATATHALVGVGLNANFDPSVLPGPLGSTATTLRHALGQDIPLDTIEAALLPRLLAATAGTGLPPSDLALARARLAGVGESIRVRVPNLPVVTGTLRGLSDDGRAIVETDAGECLLAANPE